MARRPRPGAGRGRSVSRDRHADELAEVPRQRLAPRREIARLERRWEQAEAALREALSVAEAIGNPPQLWKTHTALGRLHADLRQPETARRAWEAARAVIERVRTGLRHERLRASLERAPEVRRVYELAAGA